MEPFVQGCTNHKCQVAKAIKLFTVAPNICVSSVRKLHLVTFVALIELRGGSYIL